MGLFGRKKEYGDSIEKLKNMTNFEAGQIWMSEKKYEKALSCFNTALENDDINSETIHQKGLALFNLQKYDDAIICFNIALEKFGIDADILHNKGLALQNLEKYSEALVCFQTALSMNSDHETTEALVDCYISLDDHKNALIYLNDLLKSEFKNERHIWAKLTILDNLGKDLELENYIDEVLKEFPRYTFAHHKRGWKLFQKKKYSEAINHFDKAILTSQYFHLSQFVKAQCLEKLKKYDEALFLYDNIKDTWDASEAKTLSGEELWFRQAVCYAVLGKDEDALKLLTEIITHCIDETKKSWQTKIESEFEFKKYKDKKEFKEIL
jgi:tetratricopeptide (TPR) repeat protein